MKVSLVHCPVWGEREPFLAYSIQSNLKDYLDYVLEK